MDAGRAPAAVRPGTWTLGDCTVRRIGFGAMRLTGSAAFHAGEPSDRGQAIAAPNVLAIPGSGNPEHVRANVAAGGLHLTTDDLALLAQP